jgi:flagellar biosynthesis/type III secretory pathway protein FliH
MELAASPDPVQKEQILAILQNGGEGRVARREQRSRSVLRPGDAGPTFAAWQPWEIDLQPPSDGDQEWSFVESSKLPYGNSKQAIWKDDLLLENEAETVLKQAHTQAEQIILEARAAAGSILLQAQHDVDLKRQEGYQRGWDGVRNEFGEALKSVHAMVDGVQSWRAALTAQAEPLLVEMLKEICQTMFGEGASLDANALQINLNRVMENAERLGDLNIFLNPRDAQLLDPSWSEYQLLVSGNKIRVIPSAEITPGGCVVKGSMGMVDGRVETQLAAIMNTFEEVRESSK